MTSPITIDTLQAQAVAQRRALHNHVAELRAQVKEKLDVKSKVHRNFWTFAAGSLCCGALMGYAVMRAFTSR